MTRRKICVVTGTRADYGILYWLLKAISTDDSLELQLAVTGMHLAGDYGLTVGAIEKDGWAIAARVDTLLASNTPVAIAKSAGLGVIGFADAFEHLKPDILVVLGDRFEILAAAQAAMLCNIPIAHIHGGEVTEGAVDESIRHAITKMAHFHFVAAPAYAERILRMGEQPDRVWLVGAPALDNVAQLELPPSQEVVAEVGLPGRGPLFLVTYHPATLSDRDIDDDIGELCRALDRFPDARILITKANADAGGARANGLLAEYVARNRERAVLVSSLGQARYLSVLRDADVVIGNSSSGIVEAPAMPTPTVNIGPRQRGRLRAPSVIDVGETADAIEAGIRQALSAEFRAKLDDRDSVYGVPGASRKIKDVLASVSLQGVTVKPFHDGPAEWLR